LTRQGQEWCNLPNTTYQKGWMEFVLDPRLEQDTQWVADLALCQLRILPDPQCPWLVLVPRRTEVCELHDLNPQDQLTLMQEVTSFTALLQAEFQPEKVNVGALGNIVRQLHVHLMGRYTTDRAWPGPLWGVAPKSREGQEELLTRLHRALDQALGQGSPAPGN